MIETANSAVFTANTDITGLTITGCGGPQTITVDTSVLPASLIPNNSVLEIRPPADRGFGNITIYALNGAGFSRTGSHITGNPTGVHLVSEEIAPPPGFSVETGTEASFNWSADLSSYPCNAILSTKIWDGGTTTYDSLLERIATGNSATVDGTAYTAKITKTNFPTAVPVKLHMSVNSSWNPTGSGNIFIWWISDDDSIGQILPTQLLATDTVKELDYFGAGSSQGLATFGLSAFSGNNNPFQLVTMAATDYINSQSQVASESGSYTEVSGTAKGAAQQGIQNPNPPELKAPPQPPDPGKTEKIYANAKGVITQKTQLTSNDNLATLVIGEGVTALDANGQPLSSVSIAAVPEESLPTLPPGNVVTFAGRAYSLKPDGATFSPSIRITFTAPVVKFGEEFTVKIYDEATGSWQDVPTSYNPKDGTVTAQISHFCYFALFAKTVGPAATMTATPGPTMMAGTTAVAPSGTGLGNFTNFALWLVNIIVKNPVIIVSAIILVVALVYYKKRRGRGPRMSL